MAEAVERQESQWAAHTDTGIVNQARQGGAAERLVHLHHGVFDGALIGHIEQERRETHAQTTL